MVNWVCPHCEAKMVVKDTLVGLEKACVSCRQKSVVTDCSEGEFVPQVTVLTRKKFAPGTGSEPVAGGASKIVLIALLFCCIGVGLANLAGNSALSTAGFTCAVYVFLAVVVSFPLFNACQELRAIRRLIETRMKDV